MPRGSIVFNRCSGLRSVLLLVLLSLLVPHATAWAQAGAVSGVVTDSLTGRPVSDVLISASGTSASARTNLRGQFTLAGLTGATVNLIITRLGYQPITRSAAVGATNLYLQPAPIATANATQKGAGGSAR